MWLAEVYVAFHGCEAKLKENHSLGEKTDKT